MNEPVSGSTAKKIVVCCDGTGNQFGDANSNVVKLYTCLTEDANQISYYHPGVGTMGDPRRTSWLGKQLSLIGGLAFGLGFTSNIADAYLFLMDHYVEGDHIYLFGFSRGAYTVRALAGALRVYGLLRKGNEGHLPYLLNMYSTQSRTDYAAGRVKQASTNATSNAFRDTFSRTVPIHFLGIWDTVSSVGGLYDPVKLLYDGQNSIVRKVRHALSVDERRCFFQANLLGKPLGPPDTPVLIQHYKDSRDHHQDIVQAWFAGVHSDVGGSYEQEQSSPAMDAFRWILDEAEADGLSIDFEKRDVILGKPSERYRDLAEMNKPAPGSECLHSSLTWKWAPLEAFPHKYYDENGRKKWRLTPWPHRREIPEGALLHPSLRNRLASDSNYKPRNLEAKSIQAFVKADCAEREMLLHPEVAEKLEELGFGVYRTSGPARTATIPGAAIAAVILVSLVAWGIRAMR